ncbi:hypothetical protein Goshw_005550 [Gossypium schwendimanii]|uniref:Uncharacterized protein n=1 Tax=Gossypium schwendimanii TaxID=34291 RepID=A0A7J9NBL7_GOSSC|nr:hypothetical protein [Gossypium schwendimanii]
MAWKVGRGDNISIWKNAWVLRLKNHKIQESVRNHNLDKVVDLIDPILRQWKEMITTSTFVRGKAKAILNTPLARYPREDCRVWSGEPIGDYTVRSGYRRLIMEDPSLTTDDAENTMQKLGSGIVGRDSRGFLGSKLMLNNQVPTPFFEEAVACLQNCTVGNRKGISPSSDRRGRFQEMQFGVLIFYRRARDLVF